MVKRKGVSITVDENFFNTFEKERQREQERLRQKIGGMFNLTQRKFTAILAAKDFKFQVPRKRVVRKVVRRRIR